MVEETKTVNQEITVYAYGNFDILEVQNLKAKYFKRILVPAPGGIGTICVPLEINSNVTKLEEGPTGYMYKYSLTDENIYSQLKELADKEPETVVSRHRSPIVAPTSKDVIDITSAQRARDDKHK